MAESVDSLWHSRFPDAAIYAPAKDLLDFSLLRGMVLQSLCLNRSDPFRHLRRVWAEKIRSAIAPLLLKNLPPAARG